MKYRSFLDQNFGLWFSFWCLGFLISIVLFSHDYDIGGYLLSFCSALLIALLTAMAAFNNIDINERKKRAREELYSYGQLLQIIAERYYLVRGIVTHSNAGMNRDWFCRGINLPYIAVDTALDSVDYSKYNFLSRKLSEQFVKGTPVPEKLQPFNIVYLTQTETSLRALLQVIDRRNTLLDSTINPIISKCEYIGRGVVNAKPHNFSTEMSYFEFTNFLQLTEGMVRQMKGLMRDYKMIAECLSEGARELFDEALIKESGGLPELFMPDENELLEYVELSEEQLKYLFSNRYPYTMASWGSFTNLS